MTTKRKEALFIGSAIATIVWFMALMTYGVVTDLNLKEQRIQSINCLYQSE